MIKQNSKLSMMQPHDPRKRAKALTERVKAIEIPPAPGFVHFDLNKHSHLRSMGRTFAVSLEPGKPV